MRVGHNDWSTLTMYIAQIRSLRCEGDLHIMMIRTGIDLYF